jgi:hypothetical protein
LPQAGDQARLDAGPAGAGHGSGGDQVGAPGRALGLDGQLVLDDEHDHQAHAQRDERHHPDIEDPLGQRLAARPGATRRGRFEEGHGRAPHRSALDTDYICRPVKLQM